MTHTKITQSEARKMQPLRYADVKIARYMTSSTRDLQQAYEAKFGIQGSRIFKVSRDELIKALIYGIASTKAPAR